MFKVLGKTLLWILISCIVLVGLYILFNQFDASPPADDFSQADLNPATFDFSNGFYDLWLLPLPADRNPADPAERQKIRELFDTGFDTERNMSLYDTARHKDQDLKRIFGDEGKVAVLNLQQVPLEQWLVYARSQQVAILTLRERAAVWLQRYAKLLANPLVADFTLPRFAAPLPNLLVLLRLQQLYSAVNLADAAAGNWDAATANLLKQVEFGKRLVAGSRLLITNLVAKAITHESLRALIAIMNEPACPLELYSRILARLPAMTYDDFAAGRSFVSEYLAVCDILAKKQYQALFDETWLRGFWARLLIQPNRTRRVVFDFNRRFRELEKTPPHAWSKNAVLADPDPTSRRLWWLQNPVGKAVFAQATPNFLMAVYKSYRLKVRYDLARIVAEIHLKYLPHTTVAELLPYLDSYKELDPFSGQPYRWNAATQVLYSVGPDGKDDHGVEAADFVKHSDIAVPCLVYVQPAPAATGRR